MNANEPSAETDPLEPSAAFRFSYNPQQKRVSPEELAEKKRKRKLRRMILLYPAITGILAIGAGIGVAASIHRPQIESLDQFKPKLVTELYDSQGQIVQRYSRENRIMIEEGELPLLVQQAILATEDKNFFKHGGVDLQGVLRAMVTNFKAGRIKEGASTITMQLSRDLFQLTREQKVWRKVEEALLAVDLEKTYSKQQILTLYANMVNLGHGNYGVEAASRDFFNKSAKDLTLAEAATLAGIPQRPTHFSVYRNKPEVIRRRNWVLERMLDEKYITPEQLEAAKNEPLEVFESVRKAESGLHFSEEVRRHLISTYGQTQLYDRGLLVRTTLDPKIQKAAERALRDQLLSLDHRRSGYRGIIGQRLDENLEAVKLAAWAGTLPEVGELFEGLVLDVGPGAARVKFRDKVFDLGKDGYRWTGKKSPTELLKRGDIALFRWHQPKEKDNKGKLKPAFLRLEQEPKLEASILVLESATGAIRALVGGWNYERNEFNRVTQAERQIGSAFKPFIFGAALENGYTPSDTVFDGPVVFRGGDGKMSYSPRNYYRKYYGIITLRKALELSVNVASVKLMYLVGIDHTIDLARRCGVTTQLPPYPSLALGSADMIPLELASAYATFANQGVYIEPYMIERITTRSGKVLEEHLPRARKAMEPQTAFVLSMMLKGVTARGTAAQLARLPIDTAGKTGTTNDYTDAWFVGFTPRYTILTWVGYDQKKSLGKGMTGAVAALPMWQSVVETGLEEGWLRENEEFSPPSGVSATEIDASSGLLASNNSAKTVREYFVAGTEPKKTYDGTAQRVMGLPWYLQEGHYLPKEGETMPGQIEGQDWDLVNKAWEGTGEEPPAEEGSEGEAPAVLDQLPPGDG